MEIADTKRKPQEETGGRKRRRFMKLQILPQDWGEEEGEDKKEPDSSGISLGGKMKDIPPPKSSKNIAHH